MKPFLFAGAILTGVCIASAMIETWPTEALEAAASPTEPTQTTSIGVVVPAWRINHPPVMVDEVLYTNADYQFIAALAHGPCAVKIQITDLVSDPQTQCFDSAKWQANGCLGGGCVVIPVPREPEYSVQIGARWIRVPQLREDSSIDWRLGVGRRRAVHQ